MRTHRLGLVFFAVAIVAIYGQTFPAMLDYPEVVVRLTLWCIVVGLYPTLLMTLIGVLWFPSRAISQMHQAVSYTHLDSVTILKDLKVKGSSSMLKIGTKVKNIRLVEGDHNIDCKIDGFGPMKLKSEFVKKN